MPPPKICPILYSSSTMTVSKYVGILCPVNQYGYIRAILYNDRIVENAEEKQVRSSNNR